jgi:hypothetical protein
MYVIVQSWAVSPLLLASVMLLQHLCGLVRFLPDAQRDLWALRSVATFLSSRLSASVGFTVA